MLNKIGYGMGRWVAPPTPQKVFEFFCPEMVYSSALLIDDAYNSGISSSPTQQFAWHSALGTPAPPAIVMGVNIRIPRLLVVCAKSAVVTGRPRCLFEDVSGDFYCK